MGDVKGMLAIYWCVTNYPKTYGFKQYTFILYYYVYYFPFSVDQEPSHGLARVASGSLIGTGQVAAGATVISRFP